MNSIKIHRRLWVSYGMTCTMPLVMLVPTLLYFYRTPPTSGGVYGALVLNGVVVLMCVVVLRSVQRTNQLFNMAGVNSDTFWRFLNLLDELGTAEMWQDSARGVVYERVQVKGRLALRVREEIAGSNGAYCLLVKSYVARLDGSAPILQWDQTVNISADGVVEELSPEERLRSMKLTPKAHMIVTKEELEELCGALEIARPER